MFCKKLLRHSGINACGFDIKDERQLAAYIAVQYFSVILYSIENGIMC